MALLFRFPALRNSFEFQRMKTAFSLGANQYSSASSGSSKFQGSSGTSESTKSSSVNVPGLSKNVFEIPNSEVGPGASKTTQYKNPEYFCYNVTSYFEAEVEMLKYRCPQPSSKTPLTK